MLGIVKAGDNDRCCGWWKSMGDFIFGDMCPQYSGPAIYNRKQEAILDMWFWTKKGLADLKSRWIWAPKGIEPRVSKILHK